MKEKSPTKTSADYLEIRLPRLKFGSTSMDKYLTIAIVILAILYGLLLYKVLSLEKSVKEAASKAVSNAAPAPQAAPIEDTTPKKVSVDDDPVLGNKNAKVTLIEFSDYECPFCKKYFDETLSQIKKEYIDTGKVKLVFRDLPLSFHANAHKQAQAAECAREQGGDAIYFKYHDEIFKRTTSGGTGLALDQLAVIATELGLNGQSLQACIDSDKYKAEVDKDLADAAKVGASGTPSFFVGKSTNDGVITGTMLVGAQPFSEFQKIIDQELKK